VDITELKKISLLYVEDDEDISSELVELLEIYIDKLYVAKDGKKGLDIFKEHHPDIIISDIQMPIMDGLEMCEQIRKIDPEVPIIITTAFNEPSFLIKSIDIGVDKYVTKPVDLNKLEETLLRCAKFVFQKRTINDLLKLSSQLMDNQDNLIYISSNDLSNINKPLMNFLGFNTTEEFDKNQDSILGKLQSISEEEKDLAKKEWIGYLKEHPSDEHIIYLKECNGEEKNLIPYKVAIKYFDALEHYLIILNELEKK
jgi:YesN/AraC family two-component response regulator